MKRKDRLKLNFTRNWQLPGKERFSNLLKPSFEFNTVFRNGITWLNNENIAIYTTVDNYIECTILSTGTYEQEIGKLLAISLKPGFVALDIGANIGLQSIRMSQLVGSEGKVYSFEPLAYLQKKFKANITLNCCDNIYLFPVALADKEDTFTININENNWNQGTFSLSNPNHGNTPQILSVKVGDHLFEIQQLNRLDLVKIDVEGFEYHVLRGLANTLKTHNPRIIFEYDNHYWLRTGQSITDCFIFLIKHEYTLYQIYPAGCEPIFNSSAIKSGNILCIPSR